MPRVTRGSRRRQKRKKILARAKGYFQVKSKLYRYAKEAVDRSQKFAYIGRRLKKRDFRALWITRIAAAAEQHGLSYSRFIHGLKLAGIDLNRKMLAEMAVSDADAFGKLVELAKAALAAPRPTVEAAAPEPPAEEAVAAPKKPPVRKEPAPVAAAPKAPAEEAVAAPPQPPARKEPAAEAAVPKAPAEKAEAAPKKPPARKKPAAEAAVPKAPAEEVKAAPKKTRTRKKPAASDKLSESKATGAPAKKPARKRAPAQKKSAASDDDTDS